MRWPSVLITAASRRVGLVTAFRRALAECEGGGRVIVTDVNPLSPAVHVADRAYRVPLSSDPGYIDEIVAISRAEGVGLIVPTIDDELTCFANAVPLFAAAQIRVVVSPAETTALCNDKLALCRALVARGVAAATSCLPTDLPVAPRFPLFVKPRYGRGGVGAFAIRTARELEFFRDYVEEPVVQEYLDGPEYTIDMLCDFSGQVLSVVPRERVVIRAGVIDRGRTVKDRRLFDLALACARVVPFVGPVNIQCRVVEGRPVVFEINPRFSGGIPLTIAAGADFPRMLLQLASGRRLLPTIGQFREHLWMTSYEASLFLEDTDLTLERFVPAANVAEVA
ncbi:MAG: ATP-grasp domain-containing protein [Acidobacteriota bacterium]